MKKSSLRFISFGFQILFVWLMAVSMSAEATSEILIIRHGEKPGQGLGQLSCKGFNRALALPKVLLKRFGKPDAIVVPNPGVQKADKGIPYNYIRPLATVEPLAILLEMPVEASLAFNDLAGLESRLNQSLEADKNQQTLIAWEHKIAEQVVRNFLQHHDVKAEVPHWEDDDFDSIFIISKNEKGEIGFRVDQQHLNKLPSKCFKS